MKRKEKYLKLPPPIEDLEGEIWKQVDIDGVKYQYTVSNMGRVKYYSRSAPRLLSLLDNGKYQAVTLYGYSVVPDINVSIHRLVGLMFIPNPLGSEEINHKDAVKSHNWASNLEWASPKQNMEHASIMGLRNFKYGKDNTKSKLVLNRETGIFFDTLAEACQVHGLNYGTMGHRLNGRLKNNTSLVYA